MPWYKKSLIVLGIIYFGIKMLFLLPALILFCVMVAVIWAISLIFKKED